jgi:hypothetical protein
MLIKKFYAVTSFNGLISQELKAETRNEAIREVKEAITNRDDLNWDNYTDLEEACDVDCNNLSYATGLDLCVKAGAEFEWGEPTDDSWNIYSYPVDNPNIEENNI